MVAGIQPATAAATPAEGEIVRTEIAKGTTDAPIAIVAVGQETAYYIQNLLLKPASSSGWHTHAGPEYSVVKRGTLYVQQAPGCVPVAYTAGDAVFIQAGIPHVVEPWSRGRRSCCDIYASGRQRSPRRRARGLPVADRLAAEG